MVKRLKVVIQARMSSTRLPGKVLLPLGGIPLAALIAKRVAQAGHEVCLATSTEADDDLLVAEMARWDVPVLRGSLEDVLGRFVLATKDMAPEDLCVRMTADNPGPDGDFVSTLAQIQSDTGAHYLGYGGNQIGLPYGMAAEIFTVAALREADAAARSDPEREHVTTLIRAKHRPKTIPAFPGLDRDYGPLRATVDGIEDYTRMGRVFDMSDPVSLPWQSVMTRLAALPDAPSTRITGLVLGTVQLGLAYGAANTTGLPTDADAKAILRRAVAHGVTQIDTARAYGQSEARIGAALSGGWQGRAQVITKLAPQVSTEAEVRASVFASAHALRLQQIPVLLVHRASHLNPGPVRDTLLALRDGGLIGTLGASVQSPDEFNTVMADPELGHVQAPCNILDGRWQGIERNDKVIVHARSAFLQGLLTPAPPQHWPSIQGLVPETVITSLKSLCSEFERRDLKDLCLAWLRAQPWIDGIALGVETLAQLDENIAYFSKAPLTTDEAAYVSAALPKVPHRLLDPAQW